MENFLRDWRVNLSVTVLTVIGLFVLAADFRNGNLMAAVMWAHIVFGLLAFEGVRTVVISGLARTRRLPTKNELQFALGFAMVITGAFFYPAYHENDWKKDLITSVISAGAAILALGIFLVQKDAAKKTACKCTRGVAIAEEGQK